MPLSASYICTMLAYPLLDHLTFSKDKKKKRKVAFTPQNNYYELY